jgi:glycerol-3-phosphate acyltransferase PlsY
MALTLLLIALAYLIGAFPTSVLAGRLLAGIDIREHGSGNAGATNTFRVLGWKAGTTVALLDFAKGYFTVRLLGGPRFLPALPELFPAPLLPVLLACAVIVGHILPVWAGFRGGKGVAAGAGAVFALQPWVAAICLAGFILVLLSTGYVSVASMTAAVMMPVGSMALAWVSGKNLEPVWTLFSVAAALLILLMHRKNIGRLLGGRESRIDSLRLRRRSGNAPPPQPTGEDPPDNNG